MITGSPTQAGTFSFGIHAVDSTGPVARSPCRSRSRIPAGSPSRSLRQQRRSPPRHRAVHRDSEQHFECRRQLDDFLGAINTNGSYKAPSVTSTTTATVKATSIADSTKSATAVVTISPAAQTALTITTTGLTAVTSGVAYSANLKASGGTTPYSWNLASGSLPTGMSLNSAGSLSGTTTQTGQFSFTAQVSDASSPAQTATRALTLTVNTSSGNGNGVQQPSSALVSMAAKFGLQLTVRTRRRHWVAYGSGMTA